MKKVMLIGNSDIVIYNFRFEFIEELIKNNFDVYILLPYGRQVDKMIRIGCHFVDIPIDRHGKSIGKDLILFNKYYANIKRISPDIILTYTIKPTIYGSIAGGMNNAICIPTITGIGSSLGNNFFLTKFITLLYKISFRKVPVIFFQNKENRDFFNNHGIWKKKSLIVMGSGVNLDKFCFLDYPKETEPIRFLFSGRIMKEKGINEYLEMANILSKKYPDIQFHVCGFFEENYKEQLNNINIIYHGMVDDIRQLLMQIHCVVLPSYHEGMSNALLEAASCGRPLIASNIPGCREIISENSNGLLVKAANVKSLVDMVEKFILLTYDEKCKWGKNSRILVEKKFNRRFIIDAYLEQINLLMEG